MHFSRTFLNKLIDNGTVLHTVVNNDRDISTPDEMARG